MARAIAAGARTVSDVTELTHVTQGAVSQTVALLVADGLLTRQPMEDARKSGIRLTPKGRALVKKLQSQWKVTFAAIEGLEAEIGFPLRDALAAAAAALERSTVAARLAAAASPDSIPEKSDAQ
jgi:DNA-binding MarR family transcriptional regulator